MTVIITKLKRLRRRSNKRLIWSGNHRPIGGKGFLAELEYNPEGRSFHARITERETSKSPWKAPRMATSDQVGYLKSLLQPQEIAECIAASITTPPADAMPAYNLHMGGKSWPIRNMKFPTLKGP